jgi:hypothetical protein
MIMYRLAICCLILMVSCTPPTQIISYTTETVPIYTVDPPPKKILLLNVYNVAAKKYRDNKEEVFLKLIDSLMNRAAVKIHERGGVETQVINGYTPTAGNDPDTVSALIKRHNATHAIAVSSFDVYFDQTRVDVTKDGSGTKHREAYYDIVTDISYSFYSADSLIRKKDLHQSKFHSSRSVASGLLAAGPNVVAQKDDAFRIAQDNLQEYLNYFFPGERMWRRPVFTGKGFEAVGQAVSRQDYEAAMVESLRLINDANKEKAAKACYNCAVLFERKSQPEEAKKYLRQSLGLFTLNEAMQMWKYYE